MKYTHTICEGLELTNWLVQRGGRKIILASRSGVRNGYQRKLLNKWQEKGANIRVMKYNVAEENEATLLMNKATEMGPVGGVFHLAAVCIFVEPLNVLSIFLLLC